MNNEQKITDRAMKIASIVFNTITIVLLYGIIRITKNWEALGYDVDVASMIVFFFGLICYGLSTLFSYEIGCSVRKTQKITTWGASLIIIPLCIGIISSALGYWEFKTVIFLSEFVAFAIIIPIFFSVGKDNSSSAFDN